jgi:hypothetical protein
METDSRKSTQRENWRVCELKLVMKCVGREREDDEVVGSYEISRDIRLDWVQMNDGVARWGIAACNTESVWPTRLIWSMSYQLGSPRWEMKESER